MDVLRQLLGSTQFDIVHVDHLHLAPYGLVCRGVAKLPIVLREQNIESVILQRFAENVHTPIFRQWLDMQARRIQVFERNMAEQFDACCVISEEDRNTLLKMNPRVHARVIPAGVEERYFQPPSSQEKKPYSIALVGNFEWLPNRDALLWFLSDIFPKIQRGLPDATLYIIGKKIPAKVHQMQYPRIVLRGYVPDIKEELQQYDISVVPLRVGGGMRLKIIESFAMRVPVVSTSIGREGIPGNDGEHLLVADSIDHFAAQVVQLLKEPKLRNMLAEKAFQLASREYRWERIAEEFEHTYEAVREHASKGFAVGV
jgi:glycosyltransferase involved in cell wall biosynthesis